MRPILSEKDRAISLREKGFSYSEISKEILVSKSTLSLWLRSVVLSEENLKKIEKKITQGRLRGGRRRREQRLDRTSELVNRARGEIGTISERELWLIGVSLYWAEGSKEKEAYNRSTGVRFTNSDPYMIRLFLIWLKMICGVSNDYIVLEIYIHENRKDKIDGVIKYWSDITGFSINNFTRIYYKKNIVKTKRLNMGDGYFGLVRIRVKKSSSLMREISGWINGIFCGIYGLIGGSSNGRTPTFEAENKGPIPFPPVILSKRYKFLI